MMSHTTFAGATFSAAQTVGSVTVTTMLHMFFAKTSMLAHIATVPFLVLVVLLFPRGFTMELSLMVLEFSAIITWTVYTIVSTTSGETIEAESS